MPRAVLRINNPTAFALTFAGMTDPMDPPFGITSGTCHETLFAGRLEAGGTCTLHLTFAPTSVGWSVGSMQFAFSYEGLALPEQRLLLSAGAWSIAPASP